MFYDFFVIQNIGFISIVAYRRSFLNLNDCMMRKVPRFVLYRNNSNDNTFNQHNNGSFELNLQSKLDLISISIKY